MGAAVGGAAGPAPATVPPFDKDDVLDVCFITDNVTVRHADWTRYIYRKLSNISPTQFQNFNVSRLVLRLSLPNPLTHGVESRKKM